MASPRLSFRRVMFLSLVLALALLAAGARAAGDDTAQAAATTTDGAETTATTATTATEAAETTTTSGDDTATASTTTMPKITAATTNTDGTTTNTATMPRISDSSAAASSTGTKAKMPTLSKTADNSVPTYPAPSVPPTQNAPYMHQSSLPDGTVFIAVGSILGGLGAAVLVYRMAVAWLLHRSVKRAAMAQHLANDKAPFPAPPAPFYKYSDRESSLNLAAATGPGRGVRRTQRGPIPSATPSQTNLFFSPTAPGATGSMGGNNRESRFLPSGFYAATSSTPPPMHGPAISMTNLRPDSRGHARAVGPSPPDSPSLTPSRGPLPRSNLSTSSVNLHRPPSGRAPSAFLDDLLDEQHGAFLPPGPGSSNSGYGPPPNQSHPRPF